ncbi:MAG: hypothetical protein JXR37_08860 [Kiritimatiellae bacterium]|nr:hypothetical protein [Kiritimatiellia bacterium]
MNTRFLRILLLGAVLFVQAARGNAAAKPEVYLALTGNRPEMHVGDSVTVRAMVQNAPEIYGVQLLLGVDPDVFEIVDTDLRKGAVQIQPGTFFDPSQCFFVANRTDAKTGTIQYVSTLLNPAPSSQGDGVLASLELRAKTLGSSDVEIREAKFGTREGELILPALTRDPLHLRVLTETQSSNGVRIALLAALGTLTAALAASLVGVRVRMRRARV